MLSSASNPDEKHRLILIGIAAGFCPMPVLWQVPRSERLTVAVTVSNECPSAQACGMYILKLTKYFGVLAPASAHSFGVKDFLCCFEEVQ